MNLKNILWSIGISIFVFSRCKTIDLPNTESKNYSQESDAGKCFAECILSYTRESKTIEYPIFLGDESKENVTVQIKRIVLQNQSSTWIKRKMINCRSPKPDDCMVHCLVEIPEFSAVIKILVDTTQSKNFEMRPFKFNIINLKDAFKEMRRVLCSKQITSKLCIDVQNSLRQKGYYTKPENSVIFDSNLKASLSQFQVENNLPLGQLDYETLDKLGILIND